MGGKMHRAWAYVAVAALGLAAVLAVLLARERVVNQHGGGKPPDAKSPKPEPTRNPPPADWTHRELAEHLRGKGLKLDYAALPTLSTPDQPAATFMEPPSGGRRAAVAVFLCADERRAREKAGSLGDDGFPFGRFALGVLGGDAADRDLLRRVRAALAR
jgi:hypothetical protein